MKTSMATVCVSGSLEQKLRAAAKAGFDGVELFEPDLIAAEQSPEEIRALAARLGLTLDLYQPMRDVEGVDEVEFTRVLSRAEAKFALMDRLGITQALCCSNVATATIDDDHLSAAQLRRLGDAAERHGIRIAYEALAWGRFVDDYRRAWRIVQLADHAAVGLCIDSFHILSRGHDPSEIGDIPGEKIFYLQLADAPALTMDVLSWSRHHRLFPGEGSFDLAGFVATVLSSGYDGPLSLEVFNDTFRQTDAEATAVHARRSLAWLEDAVAGSAPAGQARRVTEAEPPRAIDFVEIGASDVTAVEELLERSGFRFRGRHRTKPVTLWTAGEARVVLDEQPSGRGSPRVTGFGVSVPDAAAQTARAEDLGSPAVFRRTHAGEQPLSGAAAPDGTVVWWSERSDPALEPLWVSEFRDGDRGDDGEVRAVDHLSLTQPWQVIDETVLFYRSVFGLRSASATDVASPVGLVRSRVLVDESGQLRLPLNVAPAVLTDGLAQHVAFACTDLLAFARRARGRGVPLLAVPANYYDDLRARFDLPPEFVDEMAQLNVLYDRDGDGSYLQLYTATVGEVFFEFVERLDGYDGYGVGNAPVRLSAQARR